MHSPTPENYHVALKAFVRKDDKVLICYDHRGEKWDLPGGRIGVGEFEMPLEETLRREIAEELGADFKYQSSGPAALFRHRRPENTLAGKPEVRIFMIGFELEYLGGEVRLSEEHNAYRWVKLDEAAELLPGGQQDGMRKYLAFLQSERKKIVY